MKWALGVALLALAGCQTQPVHEMSYSKQKEWAKKIVQTCIDQGAGEDPELGLCVRAESMRDAALRHKNVQRQQAIAGAMSDYGRSMQQQAAINSVTMPRTVNCRTQPMGAGTYSTSCY